MIFVFVSRDLICRLPHVKDLHVIICLVHHPQHHLHPHACVHHMLCSIIASFSNGSAIGQLRILRILRPLRTLHSLPGMMMMMMMNSPREDHDEHTYRSLYRRMRNDEDDHHDNDDNDDDGM